MSIYLEKLVANSLAKLIKFSINKNKIALAVSGGVDSVAMLILVDKWAKNNNVQLIIMTVDHNVRAESKIECAYVKQLSNRLGYECYILQWQHDNNFANFQERAREGRYNLLTSLCNELSIPVLLVAYHQDDLLEDYFLRSNNKGVLLVLRTNNTNYINNIRIVKPAKKIRKKKLISYLKNQKILWYEDSSNLSKKYTRNIIRKILSEKGEGFKKEILTKISSAAATAKILHQQLIQATAECITINNYGFAKINLNTLQNYNSETKINLLNYVLTIIGGNIKIPQLDSSFSLIELIDKSKSLIKTLHNCIIKKCGDQLLIYYELGRTMLPFVQTENYSDSIWCNRFKYTKNLHNTSAEQTIISYLSVSEYTEIKDKLDLQNLKLAAGSNYKRILFTLPVIKTLEKIVAIPHISYYDHKMFEKDQFTFSPKFISRFIHFC